MIAPLGVSWVINARANCDYETLKIMRDAGLHHVIVGYESGDEQILKNIKKGVTRAQAEEFTRNCKKLGITIHGAFIMGLPGETRETIRDTIEYAKKLDLESIQVSLASPYPGTEFYEQCRREGWISLGHLPGRHRPPELRHRLPAPLQPGDFRRGGAVLR